MHTYASAYQIGSCTVGGGKGNSPAARGRAKGGTDLENLILGVLPHPTCQTRKYTVAHGQGTTRVVSCVQEQQPKGAAAHCMRQERREDGRRLLLRASWTMQAARVTQRV